MSTPLNDSLNRKNMRPDLTVIVYEDSRFTFGTLPIDPSDEEEEKRKGSDLCEKKAPQLRLIRDGNHNERGLVPRLSSCSWSRHRRVRSSSADDPKDSRMTKERLCRWIAQPPI